MKKFLILCAVASSVNISVQAQSTIDTLYYDKEWKGVMEAEFANYCRITITPDDPHFPKKFKDYDIRKNYLQSEGTFVSIDKYDDSKSVFTDLATQYFPNGQIMSLINYDNGQLNGVSKTFNESGALLTEFNYKDNVRNGLCVTYFPNGNIESSFMYDNGVVAGQYQTFTEEGKPIFAGTMDEELFTGTFFQYHENGVLAKSAEYKSNVLDGTLTKYYETGNIAAVVPYSNGRVNGIVKHFNDAGVAFQELSFVNDLRCGICEFRNGDNSRRLVYKEVIPNDGIFGMSATIYDSYYTIYSGREARTVDGEKMYRSGYNTYFKEIELSILNNSDKDINANIRNIKVEYVKKNKSSKNMVISEEVAMNIYKEYASLISDRAYANAESTANAAATQRLSGSSYGYRNSSSSASSNTSKSSQSSVVGAILGAALGVNNNGYAAAGVGGTVGGAKGQNSSNTSTQTYGESRSSSYGSTSETHVDGQVRYQVYQQEKEKADKYSEEANAFVSRKIDGNKCSDFVIPAHSTVDKIILVANTKKDFDSIQVTFDYNGENYSIVWQY